jgi:hypothetical protein
MRDGKSRSTSTRLGYGAFSACIPKLPRTADGRDDTPLYSPWLAALLKTNSIGLKNVNERGMPEMDIFSLP